MMAIVRCAACQYQVMKKMAVFGANKMYVGVLPLASRATGAGPLTLADVEAIRGVPNVELGMPCVEGFVMARRGDVDHRAEAAGGGAAADRAAGAGLGAGPRAYFDASRRTRSRQGCGTGARARCLVRGRQRPHRPDHPASVLFQSSACSPRRAPWPATPTRMSAVVPFSTAKRLYGNPYPTLGRGFDPRHAASQTDRAGHPGRPRRPARQPGCTRTTARSRSA
ncbi:hypothetical protein ACU4GD_10720 [Cupriavidus basilensis]